jgi:hypothetical protein
MGNTSTAALNHAIILTFVYEGITGEVTAQNYVLWDCKGFPLKMCSYELQKTITEGLANKGLFINPDRRVA